MKHETRMIAALALLTSSLLLLPSLAASSSSSPYQSAGLELGAPFRDHAVLQRGMKLPVWGTAEAGATVSVAFAEQTKTATAGADGKWRVDLDPLVASKDPREMTVTAKDAKVVVKDLLVGEVWLCAGQSNMAIPFWDESPRGRERLGYQFGQICDRPNIRTVCLRNNWATERQTKEAFLWRPLAADSLKNGCFSAVGAWFGIFLYQALDVPIGLIGAYVGATGIQTWTPQYDGRKIVAEKDWTKDMVRGRITGPQQQPGALFNGKIAPFVPYAMKGMIWYQGEHDAHGGPTEAAKYTGYLHDLYDRYAKEFENPNFGFRFTQLAPWGSDESVYLQEAQAKFAAEEKNAAMCVIADVGNLKDIHPGDKMPVGLRLALLALKYDYGRIELVADSPTLKDWKVEGGKFVMTFDHVKMFNLTDPDWCYHVDDKKTDGLGFEVAGEDGKWRPARIGNLHKLAGRGITWTEYRGQVDGGPTLTVWSDEVKEPKRLRYLYSRPWWARVTNEVGLPLGPFHIDVPPKTTYSFEDFTIEKRDDRANVIEKTAEGFRLDGMAGLKRMEKKSKVYEVKVTCRGTGRLRVFVPEYGFKAAKSAEAVAFPIEINATDAFKEYSDFFEIQSWHPISHLEFFLDALGPVEVKSVSFAPVSAVKAAKERPRTVLTLPLAGEPMAFDGVFRRDWWNKWGVTIENGMRDIFSGAVFPRQSEVCMAADAENLYVAVLHPIPPGGIICNQKTHDGTVWLDESVELQVNPNADDFSPGHIYQLISNFAGVTYDIHNDLAIGQFYKEWTCAGYEAKRAQMEKPEKGRDDYILIAKLPFKSVAIADATKPFGLTLGRNYANPAQAASLQGAGYGVAKSMLRCRVLKGAPAITWSSNDPDGEGRYRVDLAVRGGTVAGEAKIVSQVPAEEKTGAFGAGTDFAGTIDVRDRVIPSASFAAEVRAADGSVLFAHERVLEKGSYSPKSARVNSAAREMKLAIEHYPFQKKINLRWSGLGAKDKAALAGAEVKVTTPSGKTVTLTKPDISFRDALANIKFKFEAEEYGEFRAEARAFDKDGRTIAEGKGSFPWKKLEWYENDLGKEDVLVKPYTALQTREVKVKGEGEGRTEVSCLLRKHLFGANGLLKSVVAADGEVLAAPMEFVVETAASSMPPYQTGAASKNGRARSMIAPPSFKIIKQSATRVEFTAENRYDGLKIILNGWMEYDGVIWYEMKLDPEKKLDVKRLSLRIPYANATLLHFYGASVRGERHYLELAKDCPGTGKVWTSVPYKSPKRHSAFMPFVWLGENHRGLMWFAENDRDWANDEKSETFDIVRGADGKYALDVNFISIPTTLDRTRKIKFGLLANPLKPVKVGAELTQRWAYAAGVGVCNREAEIIDTVMANKCISDDPSESHVFYLAGQEYVKGDSEMKYVYNEFAAWPRGAYTLSLPHVKYRLFGPDADSYLPIFFEWTDEFVDFLVWRMDLAYRTTRMDGIYMDNSYVDFVSDEMKTRQLWYAREDGKIQSGCDILNMREMFKRVSVLAQKYGKRLPRIVIHDTSCQVLPRFTFADIAFGGEMNIPKRDKGDHFSVFDSPWAETMLGVDWGFTRGMLTMLGPQMSDEKQTRAMYACYRIYDMAFWNNGRNAKVADAFRKIDRDFGIAADDCTFALWRDQKLVRIADAAPDIRTSYYARPGKKLLYMANQDKADRSVTFTLAEKGTLTDAETAKPIAPNADGSYTLAIPGHDLRALVLSP